MISKLSGNQSGAGCHPKCTCPKAKKAANAKKVQKKRYRASKRTVALALRPARCYLSSIMEFHGSLPRRTINVFHEYYARSVKSMYSKQFVEEEYLPQSMSQKMQNWQQHRKWLSKNAQPKVDYSEKEQKGVRVPFGKLTRYKYLAKPRWPRPKFNDMQEIHFNQPITAVSPKAVNYKLTPRTQSLARVLKRLQQNKFKCECDYGPASTVSPSALKAKCSKRTMVLAVPRMGPVVPKRKETKHGVAKNALTYNIKERTAFLAKPRPIYVPRVNDEEDANTIVIEEQEFSEQGVSLSALKYKASNHILNLARPKVPPPAPPPDIPYVDRPRTKHNVVAKALKYKISERIKKLSKPRRRAAKKR